MTIFTAAPRFNAARTVVGIQVDATLPPIADGSDKQIAWATKIRDEKLDQIVRNFLPRILKQIDHLPGGIREGDITDGSDFAVDFAAKTAKVAEIFNTEGQFATVLCNTSARYWIDNREKNLIELVKAA